MRKNVRKAVAAFFAVWAYGAAVGHATELMRSADAFPSKSWQVGVHGVAAEQEVRLKVTGTDAIQVPTSGGSSTVFSNANTEFDIDVEYESAVFTFAGRPKEGLTYRLRLGQVKDFEVELPSRTVTNELKAFDDGWTWGAGIGWNVSQGTPVSPAVSIDLGYTETRVDLDRFQSGNTTTPIDYRMEAREFQAAINISKRWARFEPFAGLRVSRLQTKLKDLALKNSVGGQIDQAVPFVGLSAEIFDGESLVAEVSFGEEQIYGAGVAVRF